MEDQVRNTQPVHDRYSYRMAKIEAHEARHMARQAAREARRNERAQRPHRDWTFEVRLGEKVYTFAWHWHEQADHGVDAAPAVEASFDMQSAVTGEADA